MTKPLSPEQRRRLPNGQKRTTGALAVRWSADEAQLVRQAAAIAGVAAGELVRTTTLARVAEILRAEAADPFDVPVTAETLARRSD